MASDSNSDTTAVVPRRPRKRDEQLRRRVRQLARAHPELDVASCGPTLVRLARLSLISERLYERCREADRSGDVAACAGLAEGFRRTCDSLNRLEIRLGIGPRTLRPPDLALVLADAVRSRRQPRIDFDGRSDKPEQ